jgi:Methylase involved in ubiquinone/menaquinone biosynthesis
MEDAMIQDRRLSADEAVEQALRERFRAAAQSPAGLFAYPTGLEGLRTLGYPEDLLAALPAEVATCYCGVGNVFAPGLPAPGETVLDVGCGAAVDALIAARWVGQGGRVEGVEFSEDMLRRGEANARLAGADNLRLAAGRAESLPEADASFDLVISNGVYNLVPDKHRALAEAFRVLKSGGRLQVADQITEADTAACPLPPPGALADPAARTRHWAR